MLSSQNPEDVYLIFPSTKGNFVSVLNVSPECAALHDLYPSNYYNEFFIPQNCRSRPKG